MEKEGPHARHAATVVYHSRDVAGKDGDSEMQPLLDPTRSSGLGPIVSRAENGVGGH